MDRIFRGCTRPALILGVPLVPLVLVSGPIAIVSAWLSLLYGVYAWIWGCALLVPLVVAMREVTRADDQRLLQLVLLIRLAAPFRSLRAFKMRRYLPFDDRHRDDAR